MRGEPGGYTLHRSPAPAGQDEEEPHVSTPQDGPQAQGTAEKDPKDWVTGDEPMTGPQKSYLETLAHEAGEELPEDLDKAGASQKIDELQEKTGRGQS